MKRPAPFTLPLCLLLLALPFTARADPTDAPFLSALVANSLSQVTALGDVLHTAQAEYQEARRIAGYAQDARNAFTAFQHLNAATFQASLQSGMESAYPELGSFRNELNRKGPWAEGTGELGSVLRVCVGEAFHQQQCAEVQRAVSAKTTLGSLQRTFGVAPEVRGAYATQVLDQESAVAVAQGQSAEQRLAVRQAQLKVLEERCAQAQDAATCQAAQNMASILGAEAQVTAAQQTAVQVRLSALQLAQQNNKEKQALREGEERRLVVKAASQSALAAPLQVTTEGVDLFKEGGK